MKYKHNTFTSIMTALQTSVDMALVKDKSVSQEPQQPTSIRYRPQVREVLDALSDSTGISLSELTNIILEESFRTTWFPLEHQVTSIWQRFQFLMDVHGLNTLDVAALLTRWNVKLSVLESRERTLDHLSSELLKTVATWFRVSPDWLRGYGNNQCPQDFSLSLDGKYGHSLRELYTKRTCDQEKASGVLLRSMCRHCLFSVPDDVKDEAERVPGKVNEIIFWRCPDEHLTECGVLVREWRRVNGVVFETVYSWDSALFATCRKLIIQLLRFCRHASENQCLTYRTATLDTRSANLLCRGRIMPRVVLDEARQSAWDVAELMDAGDDDGTWRKIWDALNARPEEPFPGETALRVLTPLTP
ncbi:TPA: hypothetical protein OME38_003939 [Klebsiella oxytoca]|nr:hypothetical protein [Klebsiella oxytoca]